MKRIALLIMLGVGLGATAFAGTYHERTQSHRVVYTIVDGSGVPVTGETVRLQVQRASDDAILDFSDNAFKFSGWTTRYAIMSYNTTGQYYFRNVTIDSAIFVSGDYTMCVSNDSATYADFQCESVTVGTINDYVRTNR